jgi:probable F420-dependent oxidoreductase
MKPFRFGVQWIPKASPTQTGISELAQQVERLGYSILTIADHLDDTLAPGPALASAAMATTTLRIGTMVSCNDYRHPVVTAKEAATIDVLSGGRFEQGLGAGWLQSEYDRAGLPFDRAGIRIERLEETLVIVKALWSGEPCSFAGQHYSINGLLGVPTPVQRPQIPIIVGGGGRKVLAIAGKHADIIGLNLDLRDPGDRQRMGDSVTDNATEQKLGWVRDAAGDRFNELEIQARIHACRIAEDREVQLIDIGRRLGMSPEAARQSPHVICGSVDQITEDLIERRERLGISYMTINARALEPMAPVVARLSNT